MAKKINKKDKRNENFDFENLTNERVMSILGVDNEIQMHDITKHCKTFSEFIEFLKNYK